MRNDFSSPSGRPGRIAAELLGLFCVRAQAVRFFHVLNTPLGLEAGEKGSRGQSRARSSATVTKIDAKYILAEYKDPLTTIEVEAVFGKKNEFQFEFGK